MTTATVLVAGVLMVLAGILRRQLSFRSVSCPVCHRPRQSCSCRWL